MNVRPELLNWLSSGDTGTSSRAIFTRMLGATETGWDTYPRDPADLGRCLRLLALAPEWAARIGEMADVGHVWASLVGRWDELRQLYYSEVTGERGWRADKTYALMRRLIDDGLRADPLVHDIRTSDKGEIVGWSRGTAKTIRTVTIRPTAA